MNRRTLPVLVWACLALLVNSCARPTTQTSAGMLVVAQTSEPATLDPLLITGPTAEEIGSLVYSYLLRIDSHGQVEPDLAERVPTLANGDISADGRTITYHLRSHVFWQDGAPFSAADVVATFRAVMDGRNAVPTRLGYDRVTDIRALNPTTVQLRLRERFAPFLTYFFETESYPILPAHLLERSPALAGSLFDATPIGTGPFRVQRWRHGDSLLLAANDGYFGGRPKLKTLRIQFIPNAQTIVVRLQTGEVDAYLAADPFVLAELRKNSRVRVAIVPIYGFLSLSMQTQNPVLRDPAVRRSLARSFDLPRDVLIASQGTLTSRDAARGLFTWAYVPRAIHPSRASLPSNVSLSIDVSRPLERTLAVMMQQQARAHGTTMTIRTYAPQQFEASAENAGPLAAGTFQLALHQVLTGADPETSWLLGCSQIPPAGYNVMRYCDPVVDRALRDGLQQIDQLLRARDYIAVQDAIARDAPFVALAQLREVEAIPLNMRGFQPSLETPFYRAERWEH